MKCRTLGESGLKVFSVGLGCMGLSQSYPPFPDKKDSIAFLRRMVEMGENFFDTSEFYGMYANEELVGEALEPVREQVVIATKFGWDIQDGKCLGLDWTVGPRQSEKQWKVPCAAYARILLFVLSAPGRSECSY